MALFTFKDFQQIFEYFYKTNPNSGGDDPSYVTKMDPNTKIVADGERPKTETYFEAAIDVPTFYSEDYSKLRQFLLDWYSSHRTLVQSQKDANDLNAMPTLHLNELLYSFGFDVGESIGNLPRSNKVNFFYDLVDLYKIKGTPRSVFEVLNFFSIPNVDVVEYWLKKHERTHEFILEGRTVYTNSPYSVKYSEVKFSEVASIDPHWLMTMGQLERSFETQGIRLPSKTPYFSVRPSFSIVIMNASMAYLARLINDEYYKWFDNPSDYPKNILTSLGIDTSILGLYLGCIYAYAKLYGNAHGNTDFLIWDTPAVNYTFQDCLDRYLFLTSRESFTTREEREEVHKTFLDEFTRPYDQNFIVEHFLGNREIALNNVDPAMLEDINFYFESDQGPDCVRKLFLDLATYFRNEQNLYLTTFPAFVLDMDAMADYVTGAIDFFKPYRARLVFSEKMSFIDNPMEDSIIQEDNVPMIEITQQINDWDTANSAPGSLNSESNDYEYYARNTYDVTVVDDEGDIRNSFFDIGASHDDEVGITINDSQSDRLNTHPSDSTSYVFNNLTVIPGTETILTAQQAGGFVSFDEGAYYDSPFMSDILQIEAHYLGDVVIPVDIITRYMSGIDAEVNIHDERFEDIVFFWRATGTIDPSDDFSDIRFWWRVDGETLDASTDIESFYSVPKYLQSPTESKPGKDLIDYNTECIGNAVVRLTPQNAETWSEPNGISLQASNPSLTSPSNNYPLTPSFDPESVLSGKLGYWMTRRDIVPPPPFYRFLFWWRGDNSGGVPIIEAPYDHNPLSLAPTYSIDSTNFVETEKQMNGNGCLKFYVNGYITFFDTGIEDKMRFGFYIYRPTSSSYPLILVSSEGRSISMYFTENDCNLRFAEAGMEGVILHFPFDTAYAADWNFIEISMDTPNRLYKVFVNGEEKTLEGTIPPAYSMSVDEMVIGRTLFSGDGAPDDSYSMDQIIIHSDPDKNLYQYRGFDVYTREIPVDPTLPSDDIIFWWTGMIDEYGLPTVRYYNDEQDYIKSINGPWPVYNRSYPKNYVSDLHIVGDTSIINHSPSDGIYFDNCLSGDQLRVGFWVRTSSLNAEEVFSIGVSGILDNEEETWVNIMIRQPVDPQYYPNAHGMVLSAAGFIQTVNLTTQEFHFVEMVIPKSPEYIKIYVDNVEVIYNQRVSAPANLLRYDSVYFGEWSEVDTEYTLIQNLMISKDPTINFYEKGYHLLTEYPKSTTRHIHNRPYHLIENMKNAFRQAGWKI